MMDNSLIILKGLIKQYDIDVLEQHLIYSYVKNKSMDITHCDVLTKYLAHFVPEIHLISSLSSMDFSSIDKISNYAELLIPSKDKKVNGAFFTPTYIVNFIVNEVNPQYDDKCIDPSCGSGAFLLGLVIFFSDKYGKSVKDIIKHNIYGSDILDYNVRRTKLLLCLYATEKGETLSDEDFNLFCCDSLKYNWAFLFDVVVGNPPYVKFQDLSEEYRQYLVNNWETIEKGTFNLYFAFFELGYKLLCERGRLGYITPNNYFTSLSGESLRRYFQTCRCIYKIIDFASAKVFDAQTYTAISFLNREKNVFIGYDRISSGEHPEGFLQKTSYTRNEYISLNSKKWRLAKSEDDICNIKIIESAGTQICSLFDICVGIATLRDSIYFVDGSKCNDDFYIKNTNKGTFHIEKEITRPVYKISDFRFQQDILNNKRRVIFPYANSNRKMHPICEEEFIKKYPMCYEYLLSERSSLEERDKKKKFISPFYIWGRSQGLNKSGIRILTPTFSQYPRFLLVREEDSFFTNGYGIFPKPFEDTLFINPICLPDNFDVVQKILNSIIMHYYVTKTSVSIEGGYPCYQKNFIERFSIPDLNQEDIDTIRKMNDENDINEFLSEKYHLNLSILKRSL